MNSIDKDISSAEMTAYWRSLYPTFSHDNASEKLASSLGIAKAHEFEKKFDYPLIGRHISVRAGFIFETASALLSTNQYDACISLASGFSLLNYYLAEKHCAQDNIDYIDTDLPHMVAERKRRMDSLINTSDIKENILNRVKLQSLDLEESCREKMSLNDIFSAYKNPLFIIEGVIYFLSQSCVSWCLDNIANFNHSACIFDYWPDDGVASSLCFKRVIDSLEGFIPEHIKSFWSHAQIQALDKQFTVVNDYSLADIERYMSKKQHESPLFTDQNTFYPVRFIVAEK